VTEAGIDAARDQGSDRTLRQALRQVGLAGRSRAKAERGRHVGYIEAHMSKAGRLKAQA
jgi:beta-ureidopropionase / N-carbamoyl-L-amino-acid hydrolase